MNKEITYERLDHLFESTITNLVDETFEITAKADPQHAKLKDGTLNVPTILDAANLLFETGDLRTAKKMYIKILASVKEARAFDGLAQVYLMEGNDLYAMDCYHEAIKIEPSVKRYFALSKIFMRRKEDGRATLSIMEAMRLPMTASEKGEAYRNLATCHHRMGNLNEALDNIDKSLEVVADSEASFCLKGFIALDQNNAYIAKSCFDYVLNKNQKNHKCLYGLARLYRMQGKKKDALMSAEKSLEINLDQIETLTFFVELCLDLNELERAFGILQEYVQKIDRHPKVMLCMAMVAGKLRNYEMALNILHGLEGNEAISSIVKELKEKTLRMRDVDTKKEFTIP